MIAVLAGLAVVALAGSFACRRRYYAEIACLFVALVAAVWAMPDRLDWHGVLIVGLSGSVWAIRLAGWSDRHHGAFR